MRNVLRAFVAALSLFLVSASETQALVTFMDVQTAAQLTNFNGGLTDQGFVFTTDNYAWIVDPAYGTPPNATSRTKFYIGGYGQGSGGNITIRRDGGGSFSFSHLDIGLSYYAPVTDSVTITGLKTDGGTVSQTVNLNDALHAVVLTGFGSLNSARISVLNSGALGYVAISYVGIAGIPEPATWAFMIAGLAPLGLRLRARRRVTDPNTQRSLANT